MGDQVRGAGAVASPRMSVVAAAGTGGRRVVASLAIAVAVAAVPPGRAFGVLSFAFAFAFRFRGFRSWTPWLGLIGSGAGFRLTFRLGMLPFRDPAMRDWVASAVLDSARIATFSLSERRSASKCQQSQH